MINSDYANGVTRTVPLTEVQAGEPQQVRSATTAHEAAASTRSQGAENKSVPTLPRPSIPFDTKGVIQMVAQLDSAMDMMSLLFKLARQAREEGLQVRDIENKLVISNQQAQVDEMRHGAKLMLVMAVVSGVMAGLSAISGAFSLSQSGKIIKQQKSIDNNSLDATSNVSMSLDKKFTRNSERGQIFNSVYQAVGQTVNSAVQVAQGNSQANAKEDEVEATISQTEKQKAEDNMSFNANFMKDLLQLMQQYSQSQNQAWKAAFGVA
ncbi:type III secretion system translocon subunit SctB [Aeromonas veronii]|uniref:type III secretion system translocon subunit AopD n=1 Tax=Aeromonas veronii TaxID=654 RepID=UPI0021DAD7E7|nr:type III secretion system translocon subunit AopD [Aeromonas veronii]UYB72212.1 type III secretion system translocon subunit SctB [Aeromonas veronii]